MEHIKKNEVAWCEYLKYLRLMFEQFENILVDRAPHLSLLLNDIQDDISREMAQFTKRVGRIFENLMEILKKLQKTIKEREFIELDYNNYASQKHKFDSTGDYPDFEKNKKAFEVEQKLKQIKNRGNILDSLITSETPLFLLLSDGISKGLGILIFFHSYDILKTFYEKFSKTSECLTNFQMDNIYLGNYTAETKQAQSKICDQIEFLKLFAKTTKPFQSVASSVPFSTELKTSPFAYNPKKVGTALYPFNGLHDFELSFDIGDKVEVYEENESGWWIGTLLRDGSYGRFPYNYFHFS